MTQKQKRNIDPDGKRNAVLIAGEMLFSSKGYTNTSIADIARQAGVAVGTVYRLFPDKPTLLATLHKAMEDRFIKAIIQGWQSEIDFSDRFDSMIDALFVETSNMLHIMPLYALTRDIAKTTNYVPGQHIIEVIAELYEQGINAKAYVDMESHIIASIAHGMVDGAIKAWIENPIESRRAEITSILKSLFKRSFLLVKTK